MKITILTKNGKPIYATPLDTIDWWNVLKMLEPNASIDEWMMKGTVNGLYGNDILKHHGVIYWHYNPLENDWTPLNKQ